jgi:hypothetical protein
MVMSRIAVHDGVVVLGRSAVALIGDTFAYSTNDIYVDNLHVSGATPAIVGVQIVTGRSGRDFASR